MFFAISLGLTHYLDKAETDHWALDGAQRKSFSFSDAQIISSPILPLFLISIFPLLALLAYEEPLQTASCYTESSHYHSWRTFIWMALTASLQESISENLWRISAIMSAFLPHGCHGTPVIYCSTCMRLLQCYLKRQSSRIRSKLQDPSVSNIICWLRPRQRFLLYGVRDPAALKTDSPRDYMVLFCLLLNYLSAIRSPVFPLENHRVITPACLLSHRSSCQALRSPLHLSAGQHENYSL